MRRPVAALALLMLALLCLCGLVFGFLLWRGQANLSMQIDQLRQELKNGSTPAPAPTPTPSGTNPGSSTSGTTTPPTTPPSAGSCVGENGDINVNFPNSKCCSGLVEVGVSDPGDILNGITAKCIKIN